MTTEPVTTLAPSPITLKLDLAAGQCPREGFEGVDMWPGSKHVMNLLRYPWPWADDSVAELHCSHYLEHVPMMFVNDAGERVEDGSPGSREAFFRLMDECWRVLVPGGWMTIIVPSGKSDRGFQDPTHRRFFVPSTFGYLDANWRKANALDHYNVRCHFAINVQTTCIDEMNLVHPQVSQRKFNTEWNAAFDYHAKLQKLTLP